MPIPNETGLVAETTLSSQAIQAWSLCMVFLWFAFPVWLVAAPLPFLVHVFWAEPHGIQATRCQWHCAKLAFKVLKSIHDYQCQQQFLQRLYMHRITANEIIWTNTGANLFLRGFKCPVFRVLLLRIHILEWTSLCRQGKQDVLKPVIAQLVEHVTPDSCSNQMVPGSIPGGRF